MSIPAAPRDPGDVTSILLRLLQQLHDKIRSEIEALEDVGLNWVPFSGTNSIATIVTHLVGSEAETLRTVAGIPCERNRDAEFSRPSQSVGEIVALLDAADVLVDDVQPIISNDRLDSVMALPTLSAAERRSGLAWLVENYGHAREHTGQILLTKQLFMQEPMP